jgi:hypothetical protein
MSTITLGMIERAENDAERAEERQSNAKRRVLAKREARRKPVRVRT